MIYLYIMLKLYKCQSKSVVFILFQHVESTQIHHPVILVLGDLRLLDVLQKIS